MERLTKSSFGGKTGIIQTYLKSIATLFLDFLYSRQIQIPKVLTSVLLMRVRVKTTEPPLKRALF